jgi:hypothetical protein
MILRRNFDMLGGSGKQITTIELDKMLNEFVWDDEDLQNAHLMARDIIAASFDQGQSEARAQIDHSLLLAKINSV